MARISSFALLALGLVSVLQLSLANPLNVDDLLEMPKPEDFDQDLHKNVRDGLLRLEVDENTNLEAINEQMKRLAQDGGEYKDLFQTLLQLGEQKVSDPAKLVDVIKSMIAQMDAEPTSRFSEIARNLKEKFIKKSYEKFVREFSHDFPYNSFAIGQFDIMFSKGLNKDIDSYNRIRAVVILGQELNSIDLTRDNFNVNEMVEFAASDIDIPLGRHLLDPLNTWMKDRCARIQSPEITLQLQLKNLKMVLEKIGNLDMARVNNYVKVCREWSDPETHKKIMENFEKRAKMCLCRAPAADQIPI